MTTAIGQHTTKVKQLVDIIGRAISANEYKAGDLLPSINQLSEKHAVSRDTAFKALLDLRERGIIDSTPGKGYFVTNSLTNVLLLLDEYTPFKDVLYNSFIKKLSHKYKVDLLFHQYSERLFNTIVRESIGRYSKYIVMNLDNEHFSNSLRKIDSRKLLLLDFGEFEKGDCAYICQDFGDSFYQALLELKDKMNKYRRPVFIFRKETKHPRIAKEYFIRYCRELGFPGQIVEGTEELDVTPGDVYIAIKQQDVVDVIKKSRERNLKCGKDYGLLAYNDIPSYEVIDDGITALSINWEMMGRMAAEFVLKGRPVQDYLPTEIRLRNSL